MVLVVDVVVEVVVVLVVVVVVVRFVVAFGVVLDVEVVLQKDVELLDDVVVDSKYSIGIGLWKLRMVTGGPTGPLLANGLYPIERCGV